ncbi:hypothetical protein BH24ACT15_BH24ACT15_24240 [soil metagenome]
MSDDPINVQDALRGVSYPASKADLMKAARDNDAEDGVMAALAQLPDGKEFADATTVSSALGDIPR